MENARLSMYAAACGLWEPGFNLWSEFDVFFYTPFYLLKYRFSPKSFLNGSCSLFDKCHFYL